MKLEPVKHSEVSKKVRNKYYVLMCIYGIQKDGADEPIHRAAMERQIQRTDSWTDSGGS